MKDRGMHASTLEKYINHLNCILDNNLIRKYIPYHLCAAMVIGAKISFILSCRADRYGAPKIPLNIISINTVGFFRMTLEEYHSPVRLFPRG